MEFREREGISFEEAERRHAELKHRYDAGLIGDEQFDAERQRLVVVDDQGRSWAISRRTGRWLYHDGSAWVEATPPAGPLAPPLPSPDGPGIALDKASSRGSPQRPTEHDAHSTPRRDPKVAEASLVSPTTPGEGPPGDPPEGGAERRRKAPLVVVLGVAGLVMVLPAVAGLLVYFLWSAEALSGSLGGDFEDDFSNTSSGWLDEQLSGRYSMGYNNGSYTISAEDSGYAYATAPAGSFDDVAVGVDAETPTSADGGSSWGVVCRANGEDFYSMGISGDGGYFISKIENGELTLLDNSPAANAQSSGTTSSITGYCVGSSLSLYVDGEEVLQKTDYSFDSGKVGLWVEDGDGTFSDTDVQFNNFSASSVE